MMNKTILLGRLTKNPDIKYSQTNNVMIATFTLAVNRKYVRETDFINVVTYSKLAEFVNKYITKGLQICVSGRIQTRNWEDDNGHKHYVTEVIAEEIDFADSLKKNNENIENENVPQSVEKADNNFELTETEDDFPF